MLENDTEENKKMALDLADSKDMNIIMSKLIELAREVDKYKVEKMANEKLSCIDDFNRCMATVKDKILWKIIQSFMMKARILLRLMK